MGAATKNDNRQYRYGDIGFTVRPEYPILADWIPDGSRVIDLACGNGAFMHYMHGRKKVEIVGIERAPSGVEHCQVHGLNAHIGEIDCIETYAAYPDLSFDIAVCNVTLHMVMYPEILLQEMARISRQLIVSFPNFGHLLNRVDLLCSGRMPRPQLFGYGWYETGQIHQLGLADFVEFCTKRSLAVVRQHHMGRPRVLTRSWPSLFSRTAVYLLQP